MKNVFLDTNILIDYVLNRPDGNDAEQLLMHGRKGDVNLSASNVSGDGSLTHGDVCTRYDDTNK